MMPFSLQNEPPPQRRLPGAHLRLRPAQRWSAADGGPRWFRDRQGPADHPVEDHSVYPGGENLAPTMPLRGRDLFVFILNG